MKSFLVLAVPMSWVEQLVDLLVVSPLLNQFSKASILLSLLAIFSEARLEKKIVLNFTFSFLLFLETLFIFSPLCRSREEKSSRQLVYFKKWNEFD